MEVVFMTKKVKTYEEKIEELKRRAEASHDREVIRSCAKETRQQIILGKYLQTGIKVNGTINDIVKSTAFDLFLTLDVDRKLFSLAPLSKEEREKRKEDSKKREEARKAKAAFEKSGKTEEQKAFETNQSVEDTKTLRADQIQEKGSIV
jgi:hypothetical protein